MSELYSRRRYMQIRVVIVVTIIALITLGAIWISGMIRGVQDPWVKWPFRLAGLLFFFTIYDLTLPALELRTMITKQQFPSLSPEQKLAADRVFYSGVLSFGIGLIAALLVFYRLSVVSPE